MLELSKGTRLAERYTLERQLGRGGEAAIWLATDRMTRASVALKIVPATGNAPRRLRDEWQTSLRLMHAHIARAFEFHEDRGVAFYSLQYIDGPDLSSLTGNALADILPPVGLVADALRYAHAKGIVHRDVKAANILLDYNGVPYLADFGVASFAGDAGGGSRIAESPQQQRGDPAQPADDIYALGVVIHELIAGVPPGDEPLRALSGEPVPAELGRLVARMLDADAAGRPDAAAVVAALRAAGFAPGAARTKIAPRRVVEDERIETVAAVRPAADISPSLPTDTTGGAGLNPRVVGASLAVLVVVLLGVVFLLPDAVEEREDGALSPPGRIAPGATSSSGDAPDDQQDGDRVSREYLPENGGLDGERIEFNENDADYTGLDDEEKLRYKVERILGELLSSFETLEQRGVHRWAPVPYRRAQDFYKAGDEAYLRKDWKTAELNYLDALTVLEPLFEQIEVEFQKALEGARAAFDAGDRAEALRLYELAVAITPNHPEARQGLERASNLETVLQLVERGLDYEEELELDAAEASFQQAVDIDPNWAPAVEGIARVRETRTRMQFDSRMSEGLEALAMGDYPAARAAFRMAEQLIPGLPEVADGLMQVDQGLRLQSINTLEQEALALERAEDWDAAGTTYEEILKVDKDLAFAIDGLAHAKQMSALHARLDGYISDPDRLSVQSVLQEATTLVVEVTRRSDIGPRLSSQRDELSRLLKRAATPLTVELVSDNLTTVSIYKVGVLGNFVNRRLDLRPGTYVAIGARPGYRDVRLEFRVAPEIDMQPVVVRCEEPI